MVDVARRTTAPLAQLLRCSVWGGLAAFLFVAMLLVVQRFVSASQPLDPVAVITLVFIGGLGALLARQLQGRGVVGNTNLQRWGILVLPGLCLVLLGVAVSSPGMSWTAFIIVWLFIVAEESFVWWRERFRFLTPTRRESHGANREVARRQRAEEPAAQSFEELPDNATQTFVRTREADVETVAGTVRADFQPGERTVYAHIGFCPPLARAPEIEVEQTDGPEAAIKLAQVLPHGARFDIRLQRANDEAVRVELAFHATCE